jgi:hypothetical protein
MLACDLFVCDLFVCLIVAKGASLSRAYFGRMAMAPAIVDVETRRMANRCATQ